MGRSYLLLSGDYTRWPDRPLFLGLTRAGCPTTLYRHFLQRRRIAGGFLSKSWCTWPHSNSSLWYRMRPSSVTGSRLMT